MTEDVLDQLKLLTDDGAPSAEASRRARERLATRITAAGPVNRPGLWERARWALAPTAAAALALIVGISALDSHHTGRVGPTGVTLPGPTTSYPDDHTRKLRSAPKRRAKRKAERAAPAQTSVPQAPSSPSAPETQTTDYQRVLPTVPEPDASTPQSDSGEAPACSPAEAPPASTTPAPPATPQEQACPPDTPPTTTPPPTTTTEPEKGKPGP